MLYILISARRVKNPLTGFFLLFRGDKSVLCTALVTENISLTENACQTM